MEKICGIYKITNTVNGKVYIGQSIDIEQRWKNHKKEARNPNSKYGHYPLYRAMRKYGIDNFKFDIIEKCPPASLNDREIFYIASYKSHESNGYNQNEGGNNGSHSLKLSTKDVDEIINLLKTTLDNTPSIAEKFGVSYSTIRDINVGAAYYREGETYPIRPNISLLYIDESGIHLKSERKSFCLRCGKETNGYGTYCLTCNGFLHRNCDRPSPITLAQLVKEYGFEKVGKMYGVSSKAVTQWCKRYGIPHKKQELIDWYNNQQGIEIEKSQPYVRKSRQKVQQIDIATQRIIQTFPTANAAARAIGQKRGNHINDVCNGKRQTAYGFSWRYI